MNGYSMEGLNMEPGYMTYPDVMNQHTAYENLMQEAPLDIIEAPRAPTPYAESVSEYAVDQNAQVPEQCTPLVTDWLTTLEDESSMPHEDVTKWEADATYWNASVEDNLKTEMDAILKGLDPNACADEPVTSDESILTGWTTDLDHKMLREIIQEFNREGWISAVEDMGDMGLEEGNFTE
jgi:hypothetical protein